MRRNKFGEPYCHTADEVRSVLDNHENGWEVFTAGVMDPDSSLIAFTAEICENGGGDAVCYIEADTAEGVEEILSELKIEVV